MLNGLDPSEFQVDPAPEVKVAPELKVSSCACITEPCNCDDTPVQQGGVKYFGDVSLTGAPNDATTEAQEFDVMAWVQNNKTTVAVVAAGALLFFIFKGR